jgi:arylsulfatase A-like enzyme
MSRPNILLIILDSARVKNMNIYGYENKNTPFLREFQSESTVYKQARSPSIHSIASHVSMFTGLHASQHGVSEYSVDVDIDATIWKELEMSYGYKTGLFTPNRIIGTASNLSDAFSHAELANFKHSQRRRDKIFTESYGVKDTREHLSFWGNLQQALSDESKFKSLVNCGWAALTKAEDHLRPVPNNNALAGDQFADKFLKWQKNQQDAWAACINLMDTHSPYIPDGRYNKWGDKEILELQGNTSFTVGELLKQSSLWEILPRLESLYDGCILQADNIIQKVINKLKKENKADDTMIIITSDHGEGFGEKSRVDPQVRVGGHSYGIHEVLTHVPLIVQYPGQTNQKSVDNLASLTNIPDAILSEVDYKNHTDKFTDEVVYSSTERLFSDAAKRFPNIHDIDNYIGPWQAVYEQDDGKIQKYIMNREKSVALEIRSIDDVSKISDRADIEVTDRYQKLSDKNNFSYSTRDRVSDELKSDLEDLGYI